MSALCTCKPSALQVQDQMQARHNHLPPRVLQQAQARCWHASHLLLLEHAQHNTTMRM